jgi:3-methyladenine DNA glycosylase Tag
MLGKCEKNSAASTRISGVSLAARRSRITGAEWPTRPRAPESDAMSRDLLKRGFKFAGSTIRYAWMQATGMVNDYLVIRPRHAELSGSRRRE